MHFKSDESFSIHPAVDTVVPYLLGPYACISVTIEKITDEFFLNFADLREYI